MNVEVDFAEEVVLAVSASSLLQKNVEQSSPALARMASGTCGPWLARTAAS